MNILIRHSEFLEGHAGEGNCSYTSRKRHLFYLKKIFFKEAPGNGLHLFCILSKNWEEYRMVVLQCRSTMSLKSMASQSSKTLIIFPQRGKVTISTRPDSCCKSSYILPFVLRISY